MRKRGSIWLPLTIRWTSILFSPLVVGKPALSGGSANYQIKKQMQKGNVRRVGRGLYQLRRKLRA